jgi:hypothetical protein
LSGFFIHEECRKKSANPEKGWWRVWVAEQSRGVALGSVSLPAGERYLELHCPHFLRVAMIVAKKGGGRKSNFFAPKDLRKRVATACLV